MKEKKLRQKSRRSRKKQTAIWSDFTSGDYANAIISEKLNKKEFTKEDVQSIDATSDEMKRSLAIANQMFDLGLPHYKKPSMN